MMRRAALAGALACGGAAARAQAPAALGVVRGTVVDSLRGRPLGGAAVFVEGTGRSALADSAGRFVLDSVPAGRRALSATHPALDEAGLDGVVASVEVPAGATADAVLATPSRRTLWRRLCDGEAPGDSVGALFGEVRDARTGALLAGARATARWTAVGRAGRRLEVERGGATAVTDSVGTYRLCGVPLGAELAVDAAAGGLDSARAQVTLAGQPYARVDLWVRGSDSARVAAAAPPAAPAAPSAPPAAAPATKASGDEPAGRAAARRGTAVLVGVVRDTLGAPRPGARVTVDGVDDVEGVTDADGRFRLANLPAGTRPVLVRAVGYAPQVVNATLRPGRDAEVAVALVRAVRLASVEVTAARRAANARLFDNIARRRRIGLGSVVDSTVIRQSAQLRTAFARVPFTQLVTGRLGTWQLMTQTPSGPCTLLVAVDGRLTGWDEVTDLPPEYVLAIEVYRRDRQVPIEFLPMLSQASATGAGGCGLAAVWTRAGR
jgi:hypothetical protein